MDSKRLETRAGLLLFIGFMRYPQTFLDDLKRQTDIVRVISDYVPGLKKKGANWMACCPFHQEKSPSFSVNPSKGFYYCFGCQAKGSVFNFVMEFERVAFPEAIKIVADKANVPLPALERTDDFEQKRREADEVIKLNDWALEWWEKHLEDALTPEAKEAREYLNGREISDETRRTFRLGFAPQSWDALLKHLEARGASKDEIEKSGLVVKKDNGGFYDRFRGRVIFPVLDQRGQAVAFGARAIRKEDEPKYLNSPETAAYTKGRHLFGLFQNKDAIRQKRFAILVEGYLDLIIPYQFGVRNLVASLGTSLTDAQAKLLGRFARKVVVNYDGDKAGQKAARRAVEILTAEDFEIKVMVLPDNTDPDEFIKQYGAEAYEKRRGKVILSPEEFVKQKGVEEFNRQRGAAIPFIQFVLEQVTQGRDLAHPPDKAEAMADVLPSLRAVKNKLTRREYFDYAMDSLRIESSMRQSYWMEINKRDHTMSAEQIKDRVIKAETAPPTVAEQQLLELLVHDEELSRVIMSRLEPEDYERLTTASIFRALVALTSETAIAKSAAPDDFGQRLAELTADDPLVEDLMPVLLMSEAARGEGEAIDDVLAQAENCVQTLKLMSVERRLRDIKSRMASVERSGETAELSNLIDEMTRLSRLRNTLQPSASASA